MGCKRYLSLLVIVSKEFVGYLLAAIGPIALGKIYDVCHSWTMPLVLLQAGDTVVFKDLYRFTREAENGYKKYMEWLDRGINMVFLDNPTVSSDYIRQMMTTAEKQDIVTKTAMESIIKLLIIVELDRGEKQRLYISQSIKDGIAASNKRSGRKPGQLDKMSDALREDILKYLSDKSIKQVDLMRKYNISLISDLMVKRYSLDTMKALMERQNPLYGRIDLTLNLKPMDYYDSALFYPEFSEEDKVRLFSVFGGIPYYNRLIDAQKRVRENIIELIASSGARLENEVAMYLNSEISKITRVLHLNMFVITGYSFKL